MSPAKHIECSLTPAQTICLPTPGPKQYLICFLSLQLSFTFPKFHISGTICYIFFWLLLPRIMLLRFIHAITHTGVHAFYCKIVVHLCRCTIICFFAYLLLNVCFISSLRLLNKAAMNICVQILVVYIRFLFSWVNISVWNLWVTW